MFALAYLTLVRLHAQRAQDMQRTRKKGRSPTKTAS
jgi:hypothetical protein